MDKRYWSRLTKQELLLHQEFVASKILIPCLDQDACNVSKMLQQIIWGKVFKYKNSPSILKFEIDNYSYYICQDVFDEFFSTDIDPFLYPQNIHQNIFENYATKISIYDHINKYNHRDSNDLKFQGMIGENVNQQKSYHNLTNKYKEYLTRYIKASLKEPGLCQQLLKLNFVFKHIFMSYIISGDVRLKKYTLKLLHLGITAEIDIELPPLNNNLAFLEVYLKKSNDDKATTEVINTISECNEMLKQLNEDSNDAKSVNFGRNTTYEQEYSILKHKMDIASNIAIAINTCKKGGLMIDEDMNLSDWISIIFDIFSVSENNDKISYDAFRSNPCDEYFKNICQCLSNNMQVFYDDLIENMDILANMTLECLQNKGTGIELLEVIHTLIHFRPNKIDKIQNDFRYYFKSSQEEIVNIYKKYFDPKSLHKIYDNRHLNRLVSIFGNFKKSSWSSTEDSTPTDNNKFNLPKKPSDNIMKKKRKLKQRKISDYPPKKDINLNKNDYFDEEPSEIDIDLTQDVQEEQEEQDIKKAKSESVDATDDDNMNNDYSNDNSNDNSNNNSNGSIHNGIKLEIDLDSTSEDDIKMDTVKSEDDPFRIIERRYNANRNEWIYRLEIFEYSDLRRIQESNPDIICFKWKDIGKNIIEKYDKIHPRKVPNKVVNKLDNNNENNHNANINANKNPGKKYKNVNNNSNNNNERNDDDSYSGNTIDTSNNNRRNSKIDSTDEDSDSDLDLTSNLYCLKRNALIGVKFNPKDINLKEGIALVILDGWDKDKIVVKDVLSKKKYYRKWKDVYLLVTITDKTNYYNDKRIVNRIQRGDTCFSLYYNKNDTKNGEFTSIYYKATFKSFGIQVAFVDFDGGNQYLHKQLPLKKSIFGHVDVPVIIKLMPAMYSKPKDNLYPIIGGAYIPTNVEYLSMTDNNNSDTSSVDSSNNSNNSSSVSDDNQLKRKSENNLNDYKRPTKKRKLDKLTLASDTSDSDIMIKSKNKPQIKHIQPTPVLPKKKTKPKVDHSMHNHIHDMLYGSFTSVPTKKTTPNNRAKAISISSSSSSNRSFKKPYKQKRRRTSTSEIGKMMQQHNIATRNQKQLHDLNQQKSKKKGIIVKNMRDRRRERERNNRIIIKNNNNNSNNNSNAFNGTNKQHRRPIKNIRTKPSHKIAKQHKPVDTKDVEIPFYSKLLSMKISELDTKVADALEGDLIPVTTTFDSGKEYYEIFQPLFLEECRAQMFQLIDEKNYYSIKKAQPRMKRNFEFNKRSKNETTLYYDVCLVEFTTQCTNQILSTMYVSPDNTCDNFEHLHNSSLVMLFDPPNNAPDSPLKLNEIVNYSVFGVVKERTKTSSNNVKDRLCIYISNQKKWSSNAKVAVIFLTKVNTILREFAVLYGISKNNLKFLNYVLKPSESKNPTENQIYNYKKNLPDCLFKLHKYNKSQTDAICAALCTEGIVLIQGPPGTGKTTTIVGLINCAVLKDNKLLICAPSNAAVDEIISRCIGRLKDKDGKSNLKVDMVRIGSGVTPNSKAFDISIDQRIKDIENPINKYKKQKLEYQKKIDRYNQEKKNTMNKYTELQKKCKHNTGTKEMKDKMTKLADIINKHRKFINECQSKMNNLNKLIDKEKNKRNSGNNYFDRNKTKWNIINKARIIFSTLSGASMLRDDVYDMIIIDESTQACELSTLIPFKFHQTKSIVLVGDPKQLPATIISKKNQMYGYDTSLFERMQKANVEAFLLNTQYRMHPEICKYPNEKYYNNRLKNGENTLNMKLLYNDKPDKDPRIAPFTFWDTTHTEEQKKGNSFLNVEEADFVFRLCDYIILEYKKARQNVTIGVVCPYKV